MKSWEHTTLTAPCTPLEKLPVITSVNGSGTECVPTTRNGAIRDTDCHSSHGSYNHDVRENGMKRLFRCIIVSVVVFLSCGSAVAQDLNRVMWEEGVLFGRFSVCFTGISNLRAHIH